ncbi:MAG: glycosyltransferase, partial [Caldilinea sp.]|nr:glycosyltransferase [Caldilinea sp.]MDW8439948.1 glycosyltransferase [Caldilineaceae bacterium]
VVGEGRDRAMLEAQAPPNVHFVGRQPRHRVRELLQRCKAFIFPGLEDFGIAPVEAMAAGRPVIAFAGGGALDTVLPGATGELFPIQSVESLASVLQTFDPRAYGVETCRRQAERFSAAVFRKRLLTHLSGVMEGKALQAIS